MVPKSGGMVQQGGMVNLMGSHGSPSSSYLSPQSQNHQGLYGASNLSQQQQVGGQQQNMSGYGMQQAGGGMGVQLQTINLSSSNSMSALEMSQDPDYMAMVRQSCVVCLQGLPCRRRFC